MQPKFMFKLTHEQSPEGATASLSAATKENLLTSTERFFKRHWGIEQPSPAWDFSWQWRGAIPNYDHGGVYALFAGNQLLYVGLGASRGGGIYKNRGISKRLYGHVIRVAPNDPEGTLYLPRERWLALGIDLVATIGFPSAYDYLASALEDYLIGELNPSENSVKRKSGAGVTP
jgi:hypothetical protein